MCSSLLSPPSLEYVSDGGLTSRFDRRFSMVTARKRPFSNDPLIKLRHLALTQVCVEEKRVRLETLDFTETRLTGSTKQLLGFLLVCVFFFFLSEEGRKY